MRASTFGARRMIATWLVLHALPAIASAAPPGTYVPVTPCRIVDTRSSAAGAITAGTTRAFDVVGATHDFSPQGGSATGCGIPGFAGLVPRVSAVALNIVAVSPAAKGNLVVYPSDVPAPAASTLNFGGPAVPMNVANGAIVPLRQDVEGDDVTVKPSQTTQVVIDVVGYFTPRGTVAGADNSCHSGSLSPTQCVGATNFAWIAGSPISLTLGEGQAALVSGSTTAVQLNEGTILQIVLGICAAPVGTLTGMTPIDGAVDAFLPFAGAKILPMSLTRVIHSSRLGGAGTYSVGMCYYTLTPSVATTDEATVTAVVLNLPN